jgi:O-antigen/teichoic acid export membrane protein
LVAGILYVLQSEVYWFVLAPVFGWIVTAFLCWIFLKPFYSLSFTKPDWLFPVETLRTAWPVAATLVINTLYFRIDAFILSSTQSFAITGAYNLAYSIFQNILVIPAFIMNSYYPLMLRSLTSDPVQFKNHLKNAILLMLAMGIVGFIGLYILSHFFIGLLTGSGFEESVISLHILGVSLPAFFLSALLLWVMMAKKLYKLLLIIYLVGFVFNLLANWYLIPTFSYIAAAWVTVSGEYLILLLQVLILHKYRK